MHMIVGEVDEMNSSLNHTAPSKRASHANEIWFQYPHVKWIYDYLIG